MKVVEVMITSKNHLWKCAHLLSEVRLRILASVTTGNGRSGVNDL